MSLKKKRKVHTHFREVRILQILFFDIFDKVNGPIYVLGKLEYYKYF